MRKALVAILLVILLAVMVLEAIMIFNIFKAKQNLKTIGIVRNID